MSLRDTLTTLPFTEEKSDVTIMGTVTGRRSRFIFLTDMEGVCQVVFSDPKQAQIETWLPTTLVQITGDVKALPPGKTGIDGTTFELQAKSWKVIQLTKEPLPIAENTKDIHIRMSHRHLDLKLPIPIMIQKMKAHLIWYLRETYRDMKISEVLVTTMVDAGGQCEGGAEVFTFDYYDKKASMTQSSQMQIEALLSAFRAVYCLASSYRAEKSHTRRHLAEFSHLEAELAFINFEDLLRHLETFIKTVVKKFYQHPEVQEQIRKKMFTSKEAIFDHPFRRLTYRDALELLREHKIYKIDPTDETPGEFFEFGDDIPEKQERHLVDHILKVPTFLIKFPTILKSFYMKKDIDDQDITESVDLLMPGVGEVVGGSMRETDPDELLHMCEQFGIDPKPLDWYVDLRRYGGGCHSGGYGLGIERFIAWLLDLETVREVPTFPRYPGHIYP